MKSNKGYGLIILLVVVAIVAFWAIKIIGKPAAAPLTATSTPEQEVKQASTPTGIIQTKAKAQAALTYSVAGFLLIISAYFILQIIGTITGINFIQPNIFF